MADRRPPRTSLLLSPEARFRYQIVSAVQAPRSDLLTATWSDHPLVIRGFRVHHAVNFALPLLAKSDYPAPSYQLSATLRDAVRGATGAERSELGLYYVATRTPI